MQSDGTERLVVAVPFTGPYGPLLWSVGETVTLKLLPALTCAGAFTATPVTLESAVVVTAFVIEIVAELLFGFGSRTCTSLVVMLSFHVKVWKLGVLHCSVKVWSM